MYEFRYRTKNCPYASAFKTAHVMMYIALAAVVIVPILGVILATGLTWLFDASVGIIVISVLASLAVTIPVARFAYSMGKISAAMLYEATHGERAAWDC